MSRATRQPLRTVELEVKLEVDPGFRLPELPGAALEPRTFTSTYYDTADRRLLVAGVTLRRRVEKRAGVWQLKLPRGAARLELELPDMPGQPPSEFGNLLVGLLRRRPLQQVARLRTRRAGHRLERGGSPVAEVVRDQVDVLDGRRRVRSFGEVEVEMLADRSGKVVRSAVSALREAGARDHDGRPKLARALEAGDSSRTEPDSEASPGEHLRTMLARQYDAVLARDPGVRLGDDPEDVHQLRVATRRVRSFLRAAAPLVEPAWAATLRAELGWLGGLLGAVRDLDVLIADLDAEGALLEPAEARSFRRLLGRLRHEHEEARAALTEAMREERYLLVLDRLEEAAATPHLADSDITLADVASGEFRRLRKVAKMRDARSSDEELHELRIKTKRARYAAELAEPAVGRATAKFVERAKALQDVLGSHQDAVVAEDRLRALALTGRGMAAALAAGRLIERARARKEAAREAFPDTWRKLERSGRKVWS